jgi:uncharacterized membrane protein YkoI
MVRFIQNVFIAILLAASVVITASPPAAAGHRSQNNDYWMMARQARISLDEAVAMVQARTGGQILSADTVGKKRNTIYRIKVLMPSGHVRIYRVDAASGRMQ